MYLCQHRSGGYKVPPRFTIRPTSVLGKGDASEMQPSEMQGSETVGYPSPLRFSTSAAGDRAQSHPRGPCWPAPVSGPLRYPSAVGYRAAPPGGMEQEKGGLNP